MKIGADTGKNNDIWGGRNPNGSVSPCPLPGRGCTEPSVQDFKTRTPALNRLETPKAYPGGFMKASPIRHALLLTGISLLFSLAACAPKHIINGRVMDAETNQPIKGAAVAIRWFENQSENNSGKVDTFDVAQDLSNKNGNFNIPDHPDKNYVMGVYKEGYICWSSHSSFSNSKNQAAVTRQNPRIEDGMQVRLEPLKDGDSRDQHAGFTVLVAEEVTASKKSPFYKAIKPLFKRWRDNLRKEFQKMFSKNKSAKPN